MSRLASDFSLLPTKRSDDRRRCFQNASRPQPKYSPRFHVDSPLIEEASGVIYKLPSLRRLSVFIEKGTPLPSASLPNLTKLAITCDNEGDWPQLFCGATLGKLRSVTFCPQSNQIGDFLGAFKRAALSSSVQSTLGVRALCIMFMEPRLFLSPSIYADAPPGD